MDETIEGVGLCNKDCLIFSIRCELHLRKCLFRALNNSSLEILDILEETELQEEDAAVGGVGIAAAAAGGDDGVTTEEAEATGALFSVMEGRLILALLLLLLLLLVLLLLLQLPELVVATILAGDGESSRMNTPPCPPTSSFTFSSIMVGLSCDVVVLLLL